MSSGGICTGRKTKARWAGRLGIGLVLLSGLVLGAAPALAQAAAPAAKKSTSLGSSRQPVLISADDLAYDQDSGIVTARGHVEITQEERVLLADQVSYDERDEHVVATGHVSLLEPDGTVLFSDYMQLMDEMKAGTIESIRVLLSDNSRMAARSGVRTGGNTTTLSRAVYSPCNLCKDDPTKAPLWQLKAYKVQHDQEAKQIEYEDAFLEVYGIPVLYTPYFSHPDPSVKRKSGFLPPSFGSSTELGTRLATPYYYNIAPERDLIITPIFTTKEGLILSGKYRALTQRGRYNLEGSITYGDLYDSNVGAVTKQGWRGHVFGDGQFDLTDNTRWGFQIQRASDQTYLRRYRFNEYDRLRSRLYAESFMGQSYFSIEGYAFQSQRQTDSDIATPLILPWATYNYVGAPDRLGGRLGFDADALILQREQGVSSRRISLHGSWDRPFYSALGEVYTLSLNLRADGYSTKNVFDPQGIEEDPLAGRVQPEATLEWRLPFVRSAGWVRQTLEPIGSVTLSPYGGNPNRIPNEDSTAVEFDDSGLLRPNRFAGLDRVESGPRAMAGMRMGLYGKEGGASTFTFGEVFRLKPNRDFGPQTGLGGTQSDYVGRIDILPNEYIDLSHRFRLSVDDMSFQQNEVRAIFGPRRVKFDVGYIDVKGDPTDAAVPDRKELYTATYLNLSPFWNFRANMRRDLRDGGGIISTGAGLIYKDECIELAFLFDRRYTYDRDISPSTSFNVNIRLLNLG